MVNYLPCKRYSSALQENGNGRNSESLSRITIVMQIYGVFEWSVEDNIISRTGCDVVVTNNTHPQSVFSLISKIRNTSYQAHTFNISRPSPSPFSTHGTQIQIKRWGPLEAGALQFLKGKVGISSVVLHRSGNGFFCLFTYEIGMHIIISSICISLWMPFWHQRPIDLKNCTVIIFINIKDEALSARCFFLPPSPYRSNCPHKIWAE